LAREAMSLAMPIEVSVFRPIVGIAGEKNPSAFEVCEALAGHPFLDELLSIHHYPEIIIHRPESPIELPVEFFHFCHSLPKGPRELNGGFCREGKQKNHT